MIEKQGNISVFVPYRGFYFLNYPVELTDEETGELFSSPIGAFIFLIKAINECFERLWKQFSSPIGAFIFLISYKR